MKRILIVVTIILLFTVIAIVTLDDSIGYPGTDSETYVLLGKSLSSGLGYRAIWLPNNPAFIGAPFIFPLLLSPVIYFFGYNYILMNLVIIIMGVACLLLMYWYFKLIADETMALLVLVLTASSCYFFVYCHEITTEIPYLFFSLLALFFMARTNEEDGNINRLAFLALIFIIISYFTRLIGVALVGAFTMYFLFERKNNLKVRSIIFLTFIMLMPVCIWQLREYATLDKGGWSYFHDFSVRLYPLDMSRKLTIFSRILYGAYAFAFYDFPNILTNSEQLNRNIFVLPLSIITFYGFLRVFLKQRTALEYYTMLYMLILFLWPSSVINGTRLIIPLIPFIFYYYISGSRMIVETLKVRQEVKNVILFFIIGIPLLFSVNNLKPQILLIVEKHTLPRIFSPRGNNPEFMEMARWIKENIPCDAIMGSSFVAPIFLHCERKTVRVNMAEGKEAFNTIQRDQVDYIVINSFSCTMEEIKSLLSEGNSNPKAFVEVYRKNNNMIYRVGRKFILVDQNDPQANTVR